MNLQEFIEKYENEAMKIQLPPDVCAVLNEKKEAIKYPDFEEEKEKAFQFAKTAVEKQKRYLRHFLRFNSVGNKITEAFKDTSLISLRIYLEYKRLLPETAPPIIDITDNGWFQVGLRFANGTIKKTQRMFERPGFKEMTVQAGLSDTLRSYVSDTYNENSKKGSKNIFASNKKMTAIYDYCIENKIDVSEWFLSKYKQIREKE